MINFNDIHLLLASQSPRRRALLKELGFPVQIVKAPDIEEVFPHHLKGGEIPIYLSRLKSESYADTLDEHSILVTADTIVWLDEEVIGKPEGRKEAIVMLKKLSGRKHVVYTGVCLKYRGEVHLFCDETSVYFKKLSEQEIMFYVDRCKPYDKAGAYGVQEWIGFVGVERMEGSYFNVMGLPTHRLYAEICNLVERNCEG